MDREQRHLEEVKDLEARVRFLIDHLDFHGLLEDHCFMFPDGQLWVGTRYEEPAGSSARRAR